jgi:hypothetical protein
MTIDELKVQFNLTDDCVAQMQKIVQSESDKLRTDYSRQIKELEKFKPHEPTEQEIEMQKTQSELNDLKFKLSLKEKGFSDDFAKYLNSDTNLDEFSQLIKGLQAQQQDYVASNHVANVGVTKEQFGKMTYSERAKLYAENPTLYAELSK